MSWLAYQVLNAVVLMCDGRRLLPTFLEAGRESPLKGLVIMRQLPAANLNALTVNHKNSSATGIVLDMDLRPCAAWLGGKAEHRDQRLHVASFPA